MKPVNCIILILLAFTMVACGHEIIIRTEYVVETPSDTLLTAVASEPPPVTNAYVDLPWSEKEQVLTNIIRKQTRNLDKANLQIKGVATWKKETIELYDKKNKEKE